MHTVVNCVYKFFWPMQRYFSFTIYTKLNCIPIHLNRILRFVRVSSNQQDGTSRIEVVEPLNEVYLHPLESEETRELLFPDVPSLSLFLYLPFSLSSFFLSLLFSLSFPFSFLSFSLSLNKQVRLRDERFET